VNLESAIKNKLSAHMQMNVAKREAALVVLFPLVSSADDVCCFNFIFKMYGCYKVLYLLL
jgi:hypothetical protein